MARALLFSQTAESAIDVDADQDVEQLINASTQGEEPNTTSMQQDWNATPREGVASQSSNQPEVTSPAPNSVPTGKVPQESVSFNVAGKTGNRTRGSAKSKSPAVKEREELLTTAGCCVSNTTRLSQRRVQFEWRDRQGKGTKDQPEVNRKLDDFFRKIPRE